MNKFKVYLNHFVVTKKAANDPQIEPEPPHQADMFRCELHHGCSNPECKRHGCLYHQSRQSNKGVRHAK